MSFNSFTINLSFSFSDGTSTYLDFTFDKGTLSIVLKKEYETWETVEVRKQYIRIILKTSNVFRFLN